MAWTDIPTWSLDVAKTIMETVRVKDQATYEHCIRVSRGSRLLAKASGLDELDQKLVEFAGLFHDIGKIGIPDDILLKPAKLTEAEFAIMKTHPEKSVQILTPLSGIEFYSRLLPGVLHHHERWDGRGYPGEHQAGLKEEGIPLASRMILIADTYDAMTADRAYRKGLPSEVAYKELLDFAGRQFDPNLVKIFLEAHPTWKSGDYKIFDQMENEVLKRAA
jgi:putative nucleotidyltransferase with HDIG domain